MNGRGRVSKATDACSKAGISFDDAIQFFHKKTPSIGKMLGAFDNPAIQEYRMNELEDESTISSIDFSTAEQDVDISRPGYWNDDGIKNSWNDTYTARRRVFPDGQCEVTVVKERFFIGPALQRKPRAKRGESSQREANDDDAGTCVLLQL